MDNGIYIALSRQMGLFRDMEITANNLANVNTTGFQGSHLMFDTYLANAGQRDKMAYATDVSDYRDLQPGGLQHTEATFDVAIQGNGYFAVETPQGERYTRAGNFQTDPGGTLITQDGNPVLDISGQRITLPEDARTVVIGAAGNISVDGEELANIGVVNFANEQALQYAGNQLLIADETPQPAENFKVSQGMLETSNVQPVIELTHMMEVSRQVAGTSKYIEIMYDLQRKTSSAWTQQV